LGIEGSSLPLNWQLNNLRPLRVNPYGKSTLRKKPYGEPAECLHTKRTPTNSNAPDRQATQRNEAYRDTA